MNALWKDKRCLVTGGAGLIGSHIADLLTQAGAPEVVVVDNFTRGRIDNLALASARGKVTVIEGDIRDAALLKKAMAGMDTVFHQAAIRITHCAQEPRLAHDVLATGTFNVLEAAVQAGVRKVVAASSASIYGMAEEFPTTEKHHPYANDTLYGAAKLYLEGLLRSFHAMFGLNYVALRYFNVYGPRMDSHGVYTEVMIRWMERIVRNEPLLLHGDGTASMDFIFVEDIARANILAAEAPAGNETYNVASGVETTLTQLAEALKRAMNSTVALDYAPARKTNAVPRRLASTEKARRELGFEAQVDLDEGLRRLVDWWRALKSPL